MAQRRERERHRAQKVKVDEYLAVRKAQDHTLAVAAEVRCDVTALTQPPSGPFCQTLEART